MDASWDDAAAAPGTEDSNSGTPERENAAHTHGQPFFWRIGDGVLYGEAELGVGIRPPMLTEWEVERAREFKSPRRRGRWLAARTIAKALVRERFGINGVVEIREGIDGEPLVYKDGLPLADVWLSIAYSSHTVACVVSDRPVALEMQRIDARTAPLAQRIAGKAELRAHRSRFPNPGMAGAIVWAIKGAALRTMRRSNDELREVKVHPNFVVETEDARLHTLAVRVLEDLAIAVVGRPLLSEKLVTRIVLDDDVVLNAPASAKDAVERSLAKARRLASARLRFQRLKWA